MRPAYENDTDQRLARLEDRDREAVAQLAANTVKLTAITERLTGGLDRIGERLDAIGETLQVHGLQLQSLSEARERQRSIGKWAAGVVSAVVVAAIVVVLGLGR